nr:GNAT family N-acetyltransferase [Okeania sp. KiyG1]
MDKENKFSNCAIKNLCRRMRLFNRSSFRGKSIGLRIMETLYKQQLLDGIKFDFVDAEIYLIPFFEKLGYKTIDTSNIMFG